MYKVRYSFSPVKTCSSTPDATRGRTSITSLNLEPKSKESSACQEKNIIYVSILSLDSILMKETSDSHSSACWNRPLELSRVMCMCNPLNTTPGREISLLTFNSWNCFPRPWGLLKSSPTSREPIGSLQRGNEGLFTFLFSRRTLCLSLALTFVLSFFLVF